MRTCFYLAAAAALTLSGCAGTPPKPASPGGDYRPVNRIATVFHPGATAPTPLMAVASLPASAPVGPVTAGFNLRFDGDLQNALGALRDAIPGLKVVDPIGKPVPVPVALALNGASLESAVRELNAQANGKARVFWRAWGDGREAGRQIVVRYN